MFAIKRPDEDMYVVPVAFDHMLYKLTQDTLEPDDPPFRFGGEQNLESCYLDTLCPAIQALDHPVCLDMCYVNSYVSRGLQPLRGLPVIFSGISECATNLKQRLKADMGDLATYEDPRVLCTKTPETEALANRQGFQEEVEALYLTKTQELIASVAQDISGKATLLESSGVYVNHYVALKDLFLKMENAMFLIFRMAERIYAKYPIQEGKTLICCSKTGAMYNSLLSMLLGMPSVYCINIGPKFDLDVARLKRKLREGQEYIYVFDFLCMGTEAKILNALITCQGGTLAYGIGAAHYLDICAPEFQQSGSIFSKFETLTSIQGAIPDYQVTPIANSESR